MNARKNICMFLIGIMVVALSSCSVSRHLPDDAYLLDQVKVVSETDPALARSLKSKVDQRTNKRTFGLFRLPLRLYCLAGEKDNYLNRTLKKMGEPPCLYDAASTEKNCTNLQRILENRGYLNASVSADTFVYGRKLKVNYYIKPQRLYRISSIDYRSTDTMLVADVLSDTVNSLLKVGGALDANVLNKERSRLAEYLHNHGYFGFNKEYITYLVDTARNSSEANLVMRIRSKQMYRGDEGQRVSVPHSKYKIGDINYYMYPVSYNYQHDFSFDDSLRYDDANFYYHTHAVLRPRVLSQSLQFSSGMLYDNRRVRESYASFGRFGALKYANIDFVERNDSTLDCNVALYPAKKISTGAEFDVTNTAGDFGVSAALSFTNRNLFRGSEVFTLKLRGAYERVTQLSDYASGFFLEYGADMSLNFPRFILPFLSNEVQRRSRATTQLGFQFNAQDRPEFVRNVFSASWSYLWNTTPQVKHRLDLLGINLVSVPWKNPTFVDIYLQQFNSRNSIVKFNYEDLFIFRTAYDFYYTSPDAGVVKDYFDVTHSVRVGVETSGNLLNLMSEAFNMRKDSLGQYRLFNIAYAQYLKNDLSWTMNMNIDKRNSLLLHVGTGIAFPYGNARMLPFEKRYYSGGANSVRGWSVRALGPGSYVPRDGAIDYINQSGDIKLDLSLEYRMALFWKFNGALFVDAGNIWTIYDYDDQPDGMFDLNTFYKQIAVSYGAGLRLDLNFLVLRFDVAMKAINPAYLEGPLRYPVLRPKLRRDFAWHFAVGYPF